MGEEQSGSPQAPATSRRNFDWLEFLKTAGVFVGVIWAGTLYFLQRTDTQILQARTRALEQIDEYSKGEVSKSKKFVDEYWVTQVPSVVRKSPNISNRDVVNTFKAVSAANPQKFIEFTSNIGAILNHLDYVSFCAEKGVCDPDLIADYYCKEVDSIRTAVIPTRQDYAEKGIKIGDNAMKYFGRKCEGSSPIQQAGAASTQ